jgi:hypothetical protein
MPQLLNSYTAAGKRNLSERMFNNWSWHSGSLVELLILHINNLWVCGNWHSSTKINAKHSWESYHHKRVNWVSTLWGWFVCACIIGNGSGVSFSMAK